MLEFFEKEFIDKLKEEQVTRSSRVKSIWAWPVDKSTPQSP
jgi:hypothetical protein